MTPVVFCTLPRSATWYCFYFFEILDAALTGRKSLKTQHTLDEYPALGFRKFHVHSIFPGFIEQYDGPLRESWNALKFHHAAVNYGYEFIAQQKSAFYPSENPSARVIYVYRNPLDQAVSLFHHQLHSKVEQSDDPVLVYELDGQRRKIESPAEFLRVAALRSFIKHYLTFHIMRERHPDNLLMVSYERLLADPREVFGSMLDFLDVEMTDERKQWAFSVALEMSSMDNIKALERQLGRSLADDQTHPSESHMRGGATGKWKNHLSDEDVTFAVDHLAEFGLSLADFILTEPE